jgi:hypothetical protein
VNDDQYSRLEVKRERNAYFRDLDQKAQKARYGPVREPRAPRPKAPRASRATGSGRGGREQIFHACSGCDRPFRTRAQRREDHPGTVLNAGGGKCKVCQKDSPRKGIMGRPRLRPDNCTKCQRPMREGGRQKLADFPGTVLHGKGGVCRSCVKKGA